MGFFAEWLTAQADGVTADVSVGDAAGRCVLLTASVPLGRQRHSVLSATATADSFQAPRLELKVESRWHNLSSKTRPCFNQKGNLSVLAYSNELAYGLLSKILSESVSRRAASASLTATYED